MFDFRKPTAYITGMARQMGLSNAIISGENGAVISFGANYPVLKGIKYEDTNTNIRLINDYKQTIYERYRDHIWVQPNEVNFSFFVEDEEKRREIDVFTKHYFKRTGFDYNLYEDGCFDILPKEVNKGWAIYQIKNELNLSNANVMTIGDGMNDIPMFEKSYFSIGINRDDTLYVADTIDEGFTIIDSILHSKRQCPVCSCEKIMIWETKEDKRLLGECDKCEETRELYHFSPNASYNIRFTT